MLDLTQLKEAEKKSTEGPWELEGINPTAREPLYGRCVVPITLEDGKFIALSRNLVPEIIEEIERLREILQKARNCLENAEGYDYGGDAARCARDGIELIDESGLLK